MVRISFQHPTGEIREVEAEDGHSLMEAALRAGIAEIEGQCGGFLNCATCHVYLDAPSRDRLPSPSEEEDELLEGTVEPRQAGSRLCCQIMVSTDLDGLTVKLPRRQS